MEKNPFAGNFSKRRRAHALRRRGTLLPWPRFSLKFALLFATIYAMEQRDNDFDVIVVGGGHAGCEAALAAARMQARTLLLSINLDSVAQMSCNPAIGGLAKGQIVREIDALGGEMAKVTDATSIHFRMLNKGHGPAVWSPRAQCDRRAYAIEMKHRLEEQPGLTLRQELADSIIVGDSSLPLPPARRDAESEIAAGPRVSCGRRAAGVICRSGAQYRCRALILTTGTFLKGLIHIGDKTFSSGRLGEFSADNLSDSLRALGLEVGRLKTGTPPRINGRTVDFAALEAQHGDVPPLPFSFDAAPAGRPSLACYITYTNERTHEIIRANLHRAPLYSGQIKGVGPRYCPSIEDKVVRFAEKSQHQLFLEPEGLTTREYYCNGIATSIPMDVQLEMVHSIRGLEHAEIMRFGYAIEYDYVPPTQTMPWLESKACDGLFLAGQINGTSGYEEAAAQGLMAGINAVLRLRGDEPFILGRSEAYIGVLIDDLVTLGTKEPYRMFTSRAEHRMMLRQDNADQRLTPYGRRLGLIGDDRRQRFECKRAAVARAAEHLEKTHYENVPLARILRRPGVSFADVERLSPQLAAWALPGDVKEQVEIQVKYDGYIRLELERIAKVKRMEDRRIPPDFDYTQMKEMRFESREKLSKIRPACLGQASRVSGVSPADISVLMVYLEGRRKPAQRRAGASAKGQTNADS